MLLLISFIHCPILLGFAWSSHQGQSHRYYEIRYDAFKRLTYQIDPWTFGAVTSIPTVSPFGFGNRNTNVPYWFTVSPVFNPDCSIHALWFDCKCSNTICDNGCVYCDLLGCAVEKWRWCGDGKCELMICWWLCMPNFALMMLLQAYEAHLSILFVACWWNNLGPCLEHLMVLIGIFIIYVDGDAFPTVVYKKLMLLFCDLLYLM